jgi:hypothetical protein
MGDTPFDILMIVIATILAMMAVIFTVWAAEEQMYQFGIRPSESTASDMAGLITIARGLTTDTKLNYGNITESITYNITIPQNNRLVCVSARARYTITDCSSFAYQPIFDPNQRKITDATGFNLVIQKANEVLASLVRLV